MYKRIMALVLSVLLIAAVFPLNASAATPEKEQEIYRIINSDYKRALAQTGKESLAGYCGLMASCQLYYRGINTWLRTADGNDHYDIYSAMTVTDGGYRPKSYSARDFSLTEALNAASRNGTRDVYNIAVGFEWTNTEAGAKFGHVVFVYAILDGMVYFTEGFSSSMNYTAGAPIKISIADFAAYYSNWTRFEGIVVFGKKDYIDNCVGSSTNLFVEAAEQTKLLSQPAPENSSEVESTELRAVAAGERLHATALYENTVGQYYYRVADWDQVGYVPADSVSILRVNYENVACADITAPDALKTGRDFTVKGSVSAPYTGIDAVWVEILDEAGELVQGYSKTTQGNTCELGDGGFNKLLTFNTLDQGYYTYKIYAECVNNYLQNDNTVAAYTSRVELYSAPFRVGDVPAREQSVETVQTQQAGDGWVYGNDTWYYYENSLPRTGWFCYNGVEYYLAEDGSVTTGWAEVNGKKRCFTATGAMRTGWMQTQDGTMYLMTNGVPAQGWHTVDGTNYYFDEAGILQTDGWLTVDGMRYYLLSDGSMATGWLKLEEGTFCFHDDGYLLAERVEQDGEAYIRPYEEEPEQQWSCGILTAAELLGLEKP